MFERRGVIEGLSEIFMGGGRGRSPASSSIAKVSKLEVLRRAACLNALTVTVWEDADSASECVESPLGREVT